MSPSPKSASKANAGGGPAQPRLNPMMACDTAFRVVARRYLGDLTANHEATCNGDPGALHQMRIALTRLRTAILFFSPMVADNQRTQTRDELKWLNARLGTVRDLDVAIERLKAIDKQAPQALPDDQAWTAKRADTQRALARALRSARYRWMIKSTSDWIENGPWSTATAKQAAKLRACPIAAYSADKLSRWQRRLLKKSRKLLKMDEEERHRLRLLNKKLSYSIEACEDLFSDKRFSSHQAGLKYLRKAQRTLGQLNDDAKSQSPAAGGHAILLFAPKREKRLLQAAAAAYRKLAAL
jgi:CHAD domain-containing protein